jgi:hypothetical protein
LKQIQGEVLSDQRFTIENPGGGSIRFSPNFGSEGIHDSHLEPENLQPLNRMEKVVEKTVPCVKEEEEDKSNLVHRYTQWGEGGKHRTHLVNL